MTEARIKTKYLRAAAALAALALMGGIFALSAQPGDASDEVSIRFASLLFFLQSEQAVRMLNSLVREAAHMLEFAALAVPVYVFFSTFRLSRGLRGVLAFAVCLLYAVSDEVHQLFVPDRAAEVFDVMMDSLGAAIAIAVLHRIFLRRTRRERQQPAALAPAEQAVLSAFSSYLTGAPFDAAQVETEAFFRVSVAHKILPMTAQVLLRAAPEMPQSLQAGLQTESMRQVILQARKTEQFLATCRALQAAGVAPLCVKGITCRVLYPELDLRISADEDLLVRDAELEVCDRVLKSLGYAISGTPSDSETSYFHAESGCMLELHRSLFPEDGGVYSRFNALLGDLFADAVPLEIGGVALRCPAPEKHLLYLILHAYKHFLISGVGIRQLADIALLARANDIDWAAIFDACDTVRLSGFLNAVLAIDARWFGLETAGIRAPQFEPETDADALLQDVMQGGVYGPKHPDHLHSGALTFRQYADGLAGKRSFLSGALFPARERMARKYPYVKKHGWLLPAAYASRLLKYAFSNHDSVYALDTADRRIGLMRKYGMIR